MPPRHVFGAVAQHREHAARPERAHEEAEQGEARRVDPVQVFDDEDDRPLAREGLEKHRDGLVQLAGGGADRGRSGGRGIRGGIGTGCRELGQQRDEGSPPGADGLEHALGALFGDERAQRRLHGRIRRRDAAEVDALAGEEPHVGRKPAFELADEPRLADARLAADDDGERRAGTHLVEAFVEPCEIGVTADHGRR